MTRKDKFEIVRVLHNGTVLSIAKTEDYSFARDVFADELRHFDELQHNERVVMYSVLKVALKRNGTIIEEHIKYYDGEDGLM